MDLPPSLRTRYRLDGRLGAGGFGTVWRCHDLELDRPVALKLLDLDDPDLVARFEREARVTGSLQHPHIVAVFDHGVSAEGAPWIAYELVEGKDLDAMSTPSIATLLAWAQQGADALSAVHAAGLVHRDVKPANFLVRGDDGHLVLVDFGIVRSSSKMTVATAEGLILGTPAYMAPELYRGHPPSPASDQYAWGASLVEVAIGRPLFPENNPLKVMEAQTRFDPFHSVPDSLGPPGFVAALRRALAGNPADRFHSLAGFQAAVTKDAPKGSHEPLATKAMDESSELQDVATRSLPRVDTRSPGGEVPPRAPTAVAPSNPWPRRLLFLALGLIGIGLGLGLARAPRPGPLPPSAAHTKPAMSPAEKKEVQEFVAAFLIAEENFRTQIHGTPREKHFDYQPVFSRATRVERIKERKFVDLWRSFLKALLKVLVRVEQFSLGDRQSLMPWVYESFHVSLTFETVHHSTRTLGEDHLMSFGFEDKSRSQFDIVQQAGIFRDNQIEIGLRHDEAIGETYAFLEDLEAAVPYPSQPLVALIEAAHREVRSTRPGKTLGDTYARLPLPKPATHDMNKRLLYDALEEAAERSSPRLTLQQRRTFERERAEHAKTWIAGLPEKIAPYQLGNWPQEFAGTALLVEARVLLRCQVDNPDAVMARFRQRLGRYLDTIEAAGDELGGGVKQKLGYLLQASQQLAQAGRSPGEELVQKIKYLRNRAPTHTERQEAQKARSEANATTP